jgi:hypothetical protein
MGRGRASARNRIEPSQGLFCALPRADPSL